MASLGCCLFARKHKPGLLFNLTVSVLHEQERRFVFCEVHDEILKLYRKTVLMDMRKRLQSLGATVKDEIDKMALEIFSTDSTEQVLDMR